MVIFGYAVLACFLALVNVTVWQLDFQSVLSLKNLESTGFERSIVITSLVGMQVCLFLLPAMMFRWVFGKQSVNQFLSFKPAGTILLVPILVLIYTPALYIISEFNVQVLELGMLSEEFLQGLKSMEDQAMSQMERILVFEGIPDLFLALFVMALVPAVCEEFIFRGVLQGQISKWFGNVHLGIWLSAAIFSFIHFQFYGFLPRLVLGAVFGYIMIHTASIWTSVLAHFLHNGLQVISVYFYMREEVVLEDIPEEQFSLWQIILVLIALGFIGSTFVRNSTWPKIKTKYLAFVGFSHSSPNQEIEAEEDESQKEAEL